MAPYEILSYQAQMRRPSFRLTCSPITHVKMGELKVAYQARPMMLEVNRSTKWHPRQVEEIVKRCRRRSPQPSLEASRFDFVE